MRVMEIPIAEGRRIIMALLVGYWAVGLLAGLCFKEGGTDVSHRLFYFIVGNAFGIASTAFLMGLYKRMNVNVAMVVSSSGMFLLFQLVLWLFYRAPLTWLQFLGILIVGAGTAMASWTGWSETAEGKSAIEGASVQQ